MSAKKPRPFYDVVTDAGIEFTQNGNKYRIACLNIILLMNGADLFNKPADAAIAG